MSDLAPILEPLRLSLGIALGATLLVVALGLPVAIWLARGGSWAREVAGSAFLLPLVLPPTVLGYLLLIALGRRGPLGHWLERLWGIVIVFHWSGALLAAAVASFPLFLISARAAIEDVDPGLEDVARLLGEPERRVLTRVTLPLAWRGIAAGALLAFTRALGEFGATLMVAGDLPGRTQTAALAIYDAVEEQAHGRAAILAGALSGLALAVLLIARRLAPGRSAIRNPASSRT